MRDSLEQTIITTKPARRMRRGERPTGPLSFDEPATVTASRPMLPAPMVGNMTARAYFAAHAPHNVPDWFKGRDACDMPFVPAAPSTWTAQQAAEFSALKDGLTLEPAVDPEVATFYRAWVAKKEALNAWRDREREAKYFAWRWYYADMMVGGFSTDARAQLDRELKP